MRTNQVIALFFRKGALDCMQEHACMHIYFSTRMIMSCLPFFYPIFMYECLDACVLNYVLVQYVCTQYCTRSMYIQYIRVYTVHTVIQIMENVAEMPVGYKKLFKIVVRIAGNCLQYSNYFQV